ncbi:hypothetical protein [Paenibacillus alginolyticus]|uniref:Uncharacterized protein n=1 Tax=Paenibacillus alginolyticus TaxID=59839 RepID=A0ABT4GNI6_9BACL|nr:hypothetical protein [Paenibacillus alginolyticus]MCY9697783.1 hypothetical protein [Paenibacillus alginolyticus]MEC0147713.1 hypothetical protein [Paenibacillus alginolyticus]
MNDFEKAHEAFLAKHISMRGGERLKRLKEGHGHAEKLFLEQIWWSAFGHFQDLHPEYEIKDFRDGTRFWISPFFATLSDYLLKLMALVPTSLISVAPNSQTN